MPRPEFRAGRACHRLFTTSPGVTLRALGRPDMQAMSSSRSDHVALEDLELFAVVAEELHFGRAAAGLHISQPGLSYRVQRLESALGYEVRARTRRSVRLTAAGEVLLEGARRVLGETSRIVGDGARVARGSPPSASAASAASGLRCTAR